MCLVLTLMRNPMTRHTDAVVLIIDIIIAVHEVNAWDLIAVG